MADDLEERLVLGDELMAKGDPQGELIAVQCELERGGLERRRGIELRKREVELLREARDRLRDTPLYEQRAYVKFRRGAIDAFSIGITAYVRDEDAIWKLAPELRHVDLHGLVYQSPHIGVTADENDWTHVRDSVALALESERIRSLGLMDARVDFETPTYSEEWAYLVTPLDGGTESVDDEIVRWLVDTKAIARFRGLDLREVGRRTLKLLATEPSATQLDDLALGGEPLHESTLGVLATTKLAPRRISLRFDKDVVLDRRVTESPFMSRVTDLTVPGLADFSIGRQLRRLSMKASFEPGWAERIANAPELSGLEELAIGGHHFGVETLDLRALHEPKHLESLRVLWIREHVKAEAVRELLRSSLGRRLEVIDHFNVEEEREKALRPDDWDGLVVAR